MMWTICDMCHIDVLTTRYDWSLLGAFEDSDVTHVEGEVNPVRDMEIIHEELRKKVRVANKRMISFFYYC